MLDRFRRSVPSVPRAGNSTRSGPRAVAADCEASRSEMRQHGGETRRELRAGGEHGGEQIEVVPEGGATSVGTSITFSSTRSGLGSGSSGTLTMMVYSRPVRRPRTRPQNPTLPFLVLKAAN